MTQNADITVLLTENSAAQELVDSVEWKYGARLEIPPKDWPRDQGDLDDIEVLHTGQITHNLHLLAQLESEGKEFVSLMDAVRYIKRNKIKCSVAILFWVGDPAEGQLGRLYVNVLDDKGGMQLGTFKGDPAGVWAENTDFLVRRRKPR